ncbi:aromatic ring-opening dioxygenase LigA [Salipiger aestuarii]|uniref:Aromatic ring-opening dioxygenase catalytic subunit (LigB family) n=1 Tax=Salipiger aestuarii TaxID=568098 RepID=A0A327Y7Q2_9RHOB|nr:class III extradiol ring-cleavage dioxygenase [Salipiger aestuarii]KAB2541481.1 aromatic ring-opening dioxygenase LigA [Salipiger aestuarii]RAK17080.1 aromatic ring-opening dioxygenase catalytic subunit (LigB family) [Salipiger aestuarii]
MTRMPTLFIPHGGGPCFFMDWSPPDEWDRHRQYLRDLPATLPARPKALLVISGHWEEPAFTVQSNAAPPLLFDYGGFPPHTYELTWPAPGDPALSERVHDLIRAAGLPVAKDVTRGFDHGIFVPLKVAFPDADIPCVQLSLASDLDPERHIALGQALAPLRDEGVLILGSGNTYHNMGVLMQSLRAGPRGEVAGTEFDTWLTDAITNPDPDERNRRLARWSQAPGARNAHPRAEHLIPLHVVAGAAGADIGRKTLEDQVLGALESAFRFG